MAHHSNHILSRIDRLISFVSQACEDLNIQCNQINSNNTKLVLICYEFLKDTVFSGNGVLARSFATSIQSDPSLQLFVICASPKHDTPTIVVDNAIKCQILIIPVKKWLRVDWESDHKLFAQTMVDILNNNDKINSKKSICQTFIQFYMDCKHLLFVDYCGYFVARNILTFFNNFAKNKEKINDMIDCNKSNTSTRKKNIVTFLNYRVFHNNSSIINNKAKEAEKNFYEKWEYESINIADCIIALNLNECKLLAILFVKNGNFSNFNNSTSVGIIDKINDLSMNDIDNKFYQMNTIDEIKENKNNNVNGNSDVAIGGLSSVKKFSIVHPPLRVVMQQLSINYWIDECSKMYTNGEILINSKCGVVEYFNKNDDDNGLECLSNIIKKRQYLLCFSRISREKNIDVFIDLIENLGNDWFIKHSIVPYIIGSANDIEYYNHLKSRLNIIKKNLNINCLFDDFMPAKQLSNVLKQTKLNVHTGIVEPYGMTICEAASFGVVSVVNSNKDDNPCIGAIELLTTDGVFLSNMTDGKMLAEDVKTILKDQDDDGDDSEYFKTFIAKSKTAMVKSLNYDIDAAGKVYKNLLLS